MSFRFFQRHLRQAFPQSHDRYNGFGSRDGMILERKIVRLAKMRKRRKGYYVEIERVRLDDAVGENERVEVL
jgi:hypothetical protein